MAAHTSAPNTKPGLVVANFGTIAAVVAVAVAALAINTLGSSTVISLIAQAVIISLLALGVGTLIRTSGVVSFGHAAPFGFGAYGVAFALSSGAPLPAELGLLLVVPLVIGVFFLVGLVVSRLDGIAFSMLTLALVQGVYVAATKSRGITGGADGIIIDMPRRLFGVDTHFIQQPGGMFMLSLGCLAIVYGLLRLFESSHYGRLAVGIRENEERVRFLGYRTRALKAAVYAMSCGIACLGGMLYALYQGFISPEIVHWSFSGSALIMAILGGAVALWGPVAGAFGFFFMREWLSDLTTHWLAVLGLTLIVVTVLWPTGLSGGVSALTRRLRIFWNRGSGR